MKTSHLLLLIAAILLVVLVFNFLGGIRLILAIAFIVFSILSGITRYLELKKEYNHA